MYCKAMHVIRASFPLIGDVEIQRLTLYSLAISNNGLKKWAQIFSSVCKGEGAIENVCNKN